MIKHYKVYGETEKGIFWTCLESIEVMDIEQIAEFISNKYWVRTVMIFELDKISLLEANIIKLFDWLNPRSTY